MKEPLVYSFSCHERSNEFKISTDARKRPLREEEEEEEDGGVNGG